MVCRDLIIFQPTGSLTSGDDCFRWKLFLTPYRSCWARQGGRKIKQTQTKDKERHRTGGLISIGDTMCKKKGGMEY